MKRWKRILSVVLVCCMALAMLPATALAADATSGTCGDNLTWTLDDGGTLTISGTGMMTNWGQVYDVPWHENRADIYGVSIGIGVNSLSHGAFYECTGLRSVAIPSRVTYIGKSVFFGCSSLTSVTIPDSVTYIAESAFGYCSSLTSVTISSSVTYIADWLFSGCNSLTDIKIPYGVKKIGKWAFYDCSSLTSITIPDSVTDIEQSAFKGCDSLTNVYYDGSQADWGKISIGTNNDDLTGATIHYGSSDDGAATNNAVYRVDFFPNGGRIATLEGQNIPALTPGESPIYVDAEGKAGVDQNSGIGWTQTNTDGKLNSIPTAERDGYVFDGWYKIPNTMDFWSMVGSSDDTDEVITNFSGFEKLTAGAVIDQNCTYVAKWSTNSSTIGSFHFLSDSYSVQIGYKKQLLAYLENGSDLPSGTEMDVIYSKDNIVDVKTVSMHISGNDLFDPTGSVEDGDALIVVEVEGIAAGTVTLTLKLPDGRSTACAINSSEKGVSLTGCEFVESNLDEINGYFVLDGKYEKGSGYIQIKDYNTDIILRSVEISKTIDDTFNVESDGKETTVEIHLGRNNGLNLQSLNNRKVYLAFEGAIRDGETGELVDLSDYKEELSIKIEPDRWNFVNGDDESFSPLFAIPNEEIEAYLMFHASSIEKIILKSKIGVESKGSCHGMSVATVLTASGETAPAMFTTNSSITYLNDIEMEPGDKTEAMINYYQLTQFLAAYAVNQQEFMKLSEEKQVATIEQYAQSAEDGGNPFLISFVGLSTGEGDTNEKVIGHAVVGYGLERNYDDGYTVIVDMPEPFKTTAEMTFDSRVRIYDCSRPNAGGRWTSYLYFNSGTGEWYVPYWKAYKLQNVTNEIGVLDPQGLASAVNSAGKAEMNLSRLFIGSDNNNFSFSVEIDGKKYSIDPYTDERELGLISYFDCAGSGDSSQTMNLFLPNDSSSYTVTPSAGNSCDYMLYTPSTLLRCEADEAASISFSQNGTISAEGVSGSYRYLLCFDDEQNALPWYYTEISGDGSSSMEIAQSEEGIIISGEALQDITILTESDSGQKSILISTNETEVLLKADNENNPAVYVDTDHDGDFESALETQIVGSESIQFTDVFESDYYYDAVLWAAENEITLGTDASGTLFSPNAACDRGQMVTFLWRAAGCPEPKSSVNPFTDVFESDYYYKAVLWAVENKITLGTNADGTLFSPNAACDRGQMATFLWRAAGCPEPKSSVNPFTDVLESDYYYKAVLWAVENKITLGTNAGGTLFSPKAACDRGQMAAFLYRAYA